MLHDLSTQKGHNAYVKAMAEQGKISTNIDKYNIVIEVRDSEGKLITDSEGAKQLALFDYWDGYFNSKGSLFKPDGRVYLAN